MLGGHRSGSRYEVEATRGSSSMVSLAWNAWALYCCNV